MDLWAVTPINPFLFCPSSFHQNIARLCAFLAFFPQNSEDIFGLFIDKYEFVLSGPLLIEANKAVPSLFQKGWDEELKDSRIFLILLGSSIGMMETEVLGYKSPFFGRRTGQLLIEPLDFWHTRKFFPKKTIDEAVAIYATLGGTPAYLLRFDPSTDYWANVRNNMLTTESYLFAEPEFILREELREPRNYFSILRAISMGKTKMSEIINETGFEKNVVGKYLSVLAELRIIRMEVSVTEKSYEKSKKGSYRVDNLPQQCYS